MIKGAVQSVDSGTVHRAKVAKGDSGSVLVQHLVQSSSRPWNYHLQPLPVRHESLSLTQAKALSVQMEAVVDESMDFRGMTVSPRWMDQDDPLPGAYIDLVGEDVLRCSRPMARRGLSCTSR